MSMGSFRGILAWIDITGFEVGAFLFYYISNVQFQKEAFLMCLLDSVVVALLWTSQLRGRGHGF